MGKNMTQVFVIGDLHGCHSELVELLDKLGFVAGVHPQGHLVISVGDFIDRQDKPLEVI